MWYLIFFAFDFLFCNFGRSVIGHCGRHYGNVAVAEVALTLRVHLACGFHVDDFDLRHRRLYAYRSRYECHFRAAAGCFVSNGITHFTGGVIADESHRVNALVCRPGGHHDMFAGKRPALAEKAVKYFQYVFGFLHAAFADEMRCKFPLGRFYDMVAVRTEQCDVSRSRRVCHHVKVHGGSHEYRCLGRQVGRDKHVVGHAVGHLAYG